MREPKFGFSRFLESETVWSGGAIKLIPWLIFEADFQPGSYGYRPKRTAHEAINCVAQGIVEAKTKIIDFDLRAYFNNVHHSLLLDKVAKRVKDISALQDKPGLTKLLAVLLAEANQRLPLDSRRKARGSRGKGMASLRIAI